MCDICERIETAKQHRDWAIECCLDQGELQEAKLKEHGYRAYLRYLYLLKGKRGCAKKNNKVQEEVSLSHVEALIIN